MHVHLVSIKVCIVGIAIGIVHADSLFASQDLGSMTHHTGFVERRLSVEDEDVAIIEVTVDFAIDLLRFRLR